MWWSTFCFAESSVVGPMDHVNSSGQGPVVGILAAYSFPALSFRRNARFGGAVRLLGWYNPAKEVVGMSTAQVADELMTIEEFGRIPDVGKKYELVHGQLVEVEPVGNEQSYLGGVILHCLHAFLGPHRARCLFDSSGRFRLARGPDLIRGPDVSYVPPDRLPPLPWPDGAMDVTPALAVEIVSSSNTAREIEGKVNEYLSHGVQLVWVVYPEIPCVHIRDAEGLVAVRGRSDTLDGGSVLPGFRLPMAKLFPPSEM